MGSLIAALNAQSPATAGQNISAANLETLSDIYAANPTNAGYTDNPFGYKESPAVIQTAYPKYGYNATAPQVPKSYEDLDLTSLFGMLEKMKKPQDDRLTPADPLGVTAGTQGDAGPMAVPNLYVNTQGDAGPMAVPTTTTQPVTPGGKLAQVPVPTTTTQPVTPAGILGALTTQIAETKPVTTGVDPNLPPVADAYTVPGSDMKAAQVAAAKKAAAEDGAAKAAATAAAAAAQQAAIDKAVKEQMAANAPKYPNPWTGGMSTIADGGVPNFYQNQ